MSSSLETIGHLIQNQNFEEAINNLKKLIKKEEKNWRSLRLRF